MLSPVSAVLRKDKESTGNLELSYGSGFAARTFCGRGRLELLGSLLSLFLKGLLQWLE